MKREFILGYFFMNKFLICKRGGGTWGGVVRSVEGR